MGIGTNDGKAAGAATEALIAKRRDVRRWWQGEAKAPAGMVGLALSGGGIRSATFSLGLLQALAKAPRDALAKIDLLSTVSGGGYIGCFLRSLFVPQEARGIAPAIDGRPMTPADVARRPDLIEDQHAFARAVLRSGPHDKDIAWPPGATESNLRRNPLWWLREHSRYLAPNGPTDYGYAVAYVARNWIAMIYIFALALASLLSIGVVIEAGLATPRGGLLDWTWIHLAAGAPVTDACGACRVPPGRMVPVSPIVVLAIVPVVASSVLSIAYWLTQAMSANEPDVKRQRRNLRVGIGGAAIGGAAVALFTLWITPNDPAAWWYWLRPRGTHGWALLWAIGAGLLLSALAIVTAFIRALRLSGKDALLTSELRRGLTRALATSNACMLVILSLALIDSAAAGLDYWIRHGARSTFSAVGPALFPALAFLIKKLPDWFGGSGKGGIASLIARFVSTAAFIAGVLLYGMLAIGAVAIVHHVTWQDAAWTSAPVWRDLVLFVVILWTLALVSGRASGFINLSSLHLLYATRLTRAYLGASNTARLEAAASALEGRADKGEGAAITDNHAADYIQPALYSRMDLPAPVHIINATINETIDPQSQLVARDRKGDILTVGPDGVRIGVSEIVQWSDIGKTDHAEAISIGQWCAISGAAASSGMGRMTNLGFALAITFANVRLGYWWWSPGACRTSKAGPGLATVIALFGTFVYLFNEMTARYSRGYARKYLTDGGHFENSAAYALIRRRVPLILVSDNGADPLYAFADLQNLIRKVRLDMGGETTILGGTELGAFLNTLGTTERGLFVDPDASPDWQTEMLKPDEKASFLVLRVDMGDATLHLLWIKPRLFTGLAQDVTGYASDNPSFPQQTTGDQFFDEAQWESYRKLGEASMMRLLEACPRLLA